MVSSGGLYHIKETEYEMWGIFFGLHQYWEILTMLQSSLLCYLSYRRSVEWWLLHFSLQMVGHGSDGACTSSKFLEPCQDYVSFHRFLSQFDTDADRIVIWTFLPSNVAGRTKKTVTATILFVAYCIGNAVGAQMFVASDAPRYIRGLTACGILYGIEFCSFAAWRFYCPYYYPPSTLKR